MLIRDHNQALGKIKELRDARLADSVKANNNQVNRSITTKNANGDAQLTPEHQRVMEKLAMLSGTDFDREFIAVMVRNHRQAVRDFEAQTHAHGNESTSSNKPATSSSDQAQAVTRQKPQQSEEKKYSTADLRRDADTADFAQATLPTLRHHLQEAEAIQKEIGTTK
jgi:predicted outer membrane protein